MKLHQTNSYMQIPEEKERRTEAESLLKNIND